MRNKAKKAYTKNKSISSTNTDANTNAEIKAVNTEEIEKTENEAAPANDVSAEKIAVGEVNNKEPVKPDSVEQDFFDYDKYIKHQKKSIQKEKRISGKIEVNVKQKPPKFIPAGNEKSLKNESAKLIGKIKAEELESIENLKKMFDAALDDDVKEIAEIVSEEPVPEIPAHNTEALRRRLNYILGIAVSILAVIGLISVISFSAGKIHEFADNTQQKNDFAQFLYPVVICDPPMFSQTVKLRNDTLITAAAWDVILYEDKSKYAAEFDYIIVPELDIEKHAAKLFGAGLSIEHTSILSADITFYYDEEIKSYRIPSNPRYFSYSPYIESIERVGERYTLTVGYVSPTPSWFSLTNEDKPVPEKYVEYVVSKRGSEYTLISIQKSDKVGLNSQHL